MNNRQQDSDSQLLRMKQSVQLSQFMDKQIPNTILKDSADFMAVRLAIQASQRWPRDRMARLVKLRTQIETGTYKVTSQTIATCMIINETHFFSVQTH